MRADFKYFPLQSTVEHTVINSQRDLITKTLAKAFSMLDDWHAMTLPEIRAFEKEVSERARSQLATVVKGAAHFHGSGSSHAVVPSPSSATVPTRHSVEGGAAAPPSAASAAAAAASVPPIVAATGGDGGGHTAAAAAAASKPGAGEASNGHGDAAEGAETSTSSTAPSAAAAVTQ